MLSCLYSITSVGNAPRTFHFCKLSGLIFYSFFPPSWAGNLLLLRARVALVKSWGKQKREEKTSWWQLDKTLRAGPNPDPPEVVLSQQKVSLPPRKYWILWNRINFSCWGNSLRVVVGWEMLIEETTQSSFIFWDLLVGIYSMQWWKWEINSIITRSYRSRPGLVLFCQ